MSIRGNRFHNENLHKSVHTNCVNYRGQTDAYMHFYMDVGRESCRYIESAIESQRKSQRTNLIIGRFFVVAV